MELWLLALKGRIVGKLRSIYQASEEISYLEPEDLRHPRMKITKSLFFPPYQMYENFVTREVLRRINIYKCGSLNLVPGNPAVSTTIP